MFYLVRFPKGENRSISEFVAVPNMTDRDDPANSDKVYIGAILTDNSLENEDDRMRSTDVAAIVVDLGKKDTESFVIASDPSDKGYYIYSAPMPAGCKDYCSVTYAMTWLRQDNGEEITSIKDLLTLTPSHTAYKLS